MKALTYEEWRKKDTTFNLMLDFIYKINRGKCSETLDQLLKKEYIKYLGEQK